MLQVSAMAVLEEEAGQFLIPHVPTILNVYAQALMHYKTKVIKSSRIGADGTLYGRWK